jgi:hypothetical protein
LRTGARFTTENRSLFPINASNVGFVVPAGDVMPSGAAVAAAVNAIKVTATTNATSTPRLKTRIIPPPFLCVETPAAP